MSKPTYKELEENSVSEALRKVQQAFISGRLGPEVAESGVTRGAGKAIYPAIQTPQTMPRNYTHPYFWGAFIAIGGWK